MNTNPEQQMIDAHKVGRYLAQNNVSELHIEGTILRLYFTHDERVACFAGYKGEKRRKEKGGL